MLVFKRLWVLLSALGACAVALTGGCQAVIESCTVDSDCAEGLVCVLPEGESSGACGVSNACECFAGTERPCPNPVGICATQTQRCGSVVGDENYCKWITSDCGTSEVCDGEDNDCDGVTDNNLTADLTLGAQGSACDSTPLAGGVGACLAAGVVDCVPNAAGIVPGTTDLICTDGTGEIAENRTYGTPLQPLPRATGVCNCIDDNCDGSMDEFSFQTPRIESGESGLMRPWSMLETQGTHLMAVQATDTLISLVAADGSDELVEMFEGTQPTLLPSTRHDAILMYLQRQSNNVHEVVMTSVTVSLSTGELTLASPVCISCGEGATEGPTFYDATSVSSLNDRYLVIYNRPAHNTLNSVQAGDDLVVVPQSRGVLITTKTKDRDAVDVRVVPRRRDLVFVAILRQTNPTTSPNDAELVLAPAVANGRVQLQESTVIESAFALQQDGARGLVDMAYEPESDTTVVAWLSSGDIKLGRWGLGSAGNSSFASPVLDPVVLPTDGGHTSLQEINLSVLCSERALLAYEVSRDGTSFEVEGQAVALGDGASLGFSSNTGADMVAPRLIRTDSNVYWGALHGSKLSPVMDAVPCDL